MLFLMAPIPKIYRHIVCIIAALNTLWLDQFNEVVVLAVVIIVHPPNLGLIKEGFGRLGQPNLWLIKEGFGRAGQPVNTSP